MIRNLNRQVPGKLPSASELTRAYQGVEASSVTFASPQLGVQGAGDWSHQAGNSISGRLPEFRARISGSPSSGGYPWVAVQEDTSGAWADITTGAEGFTTAFPAFEASGNLLVPENAIVLLRLGFVNASGVGQEYVFDYPADLVTSVTGDLPIVADPTTGNVVVSLDTNGVTYAYIQQASTVTLLGNPTGGTANVSEITLGAGLAFSGTTLVSTGVTSATGTLPIVVAPTTGDVFVSINVMTAATSMAPGLSGATPAVGTGDQLNFLSGAATWLPVVYFLTATAPVTVSANSGSITVAINDAAYGQSGVINGADQYLGADTKYADQLAVLAPPGNGVNVATFLAANSSTAGSDVWGGVFDQIFMTGRMGFGDPGLTTFYVENAAGVFDVSNDAATFSFTLSSTSFNIFGAGIVFSVNSTLGVTGTGGGGDTFLGGIITALATNATGPYAVGATGNWAGTPPTTVAEALDRLAAAGNTNTWPA